MAADTGADPVDFKTAADGIPKMADEQRAVQSQIMRGL